MREKFSRFPHPHVYRPTNGNSLPIRDKLLTFSLSSLTLSVAWTYLIPAAQFVVER